MLDRNGLRPSRYYVTKDDLVVMASEVGALDIPEENILLKERLHPGRIFLIDTEQGRIIADEEIKRDLASQQPYAEWLARTWWRSRTSSLRRCCPARSLHDAEPAADLRLHAGGSQDPAGADGAERRRSDRVHGHRHRARRAVGQAAAAHDYFTQLFAQVTNPPLDAIREELVTSMGSTIGPEANL